MNHQDFNKNNTNMLNAGLKIKQNGFMIGSTYDNRRKMNLDNDSLNSFTITQNVSPKESSLNHSYELKRIPNNQHKNKVNTTNGSAIGLANAYRNQISSNFFSGRETMNNSSRKMKELRIDENNESLTKLKHQNPTPRLYLIPSAKSVANSSYRVSHR